MKRTSILKRGNGFKKVVGNSFLNKKTTLKKSSFKKTPTKQQSEVIKADSKFARYIKERDSKCMRCGSTMFLTCSHYHGRAIWSTRYVPMNCITFCVECHVYMESKKNGEYKEFMKGWLGLDLFNVLETISETKISKESALLFAIPILEPIIMNLDIQY